jgi:hypothetical protein
LRARQKALRTRFRALRARQKTFAHEAPELCVQGKSLAHEAPRLARKAKSFAHEAPSFACKAKSLAYKVPRLVRKARSCVDGAKSLAREEPAAGTPGSLARLPAPARGLGGAHGQPAAGAASISALRVEWPDMACRSSRQGGLGARPENRSQPVTDPARGRARECGSAARYTLNRHCGLQPAPLLGLCRLMVIRTRFYTRFRDRAPLLAHPACAPILRPRGEVAVRPCFATSAV